ncbi:MAG TPA: hypothetical protein PLM89_05235, partial [Anaerolineales bacterium]|nr:hypothetical protein [Anaerolineales bacterium]
LGATSVIIPNQKLLLRISPPATATFTPAPATITPLPSASMTSPPTTEITPTAIVVAEEFDNSSSAGVMLFVGILLVGGLLWWRFSRKN